MAVVGVKPRQAGDIEALERQFSIFGSGLTGYGLVQLEVTTGEARILAGLLRAGGRAARARAQNAVLEGDLIAARIVECDMRTRTLAAWDFLRSLVMTAAAFALALSVYGAGLRMMGL